MVSRIHQVISANTQPVESGQLSGDLNDIPDVTIEKFGVMKS